jgi:tRNA1(Val) A37 N6-methylase TrmN6
MISARNNSKSMSHILPPLIVLDENENYSVKAQKVFDKAQTKSIKGDF